MTQTRRESGRIATEYVVQNLTERGYRVEANGSSLTVYDPSGNYFEAKVTSLSSPNAWIVPVLENIDTYFILVFKPRGQKPNIFILKPDEMHNEKQKHYEAMKKPIREYNNPELEKQGLSFKQPFLYENNWHSLPK